MIANCFPLLHEYIQDLQSEKEQIPTPRREALQQLATHIRQRLTNEGEVRLNFICTHNSRRSHLAQIWAATAAAWYGLERVRTYSGGTEATAFNPRAVAALQRAGFRIESPGGDNPRYQVSFAENGPVLHCFSKVFDHPENPRTDFAAIMTCSEADENCPFIPGATFRLPLTYADPKEADGTPAETSRYDERVRQIGRELFFAFQLINHD